MSAVPTLASCVPSGTRLFLELRGLDTLLRTPAGLSMAAGLTRLFQDAPASSSQPEPLPGMRELFASAVGLEDRQASQILLAGQLAVAAESWSGLSDAIFMSWPRDPAALEGQLAGLRIQATANARVRRYQLAYEHELACDGRTVVLGRHDKRTGLYARALELLEGPGPPGASLGESREFKERLAAIPSASQVVIYMAKASSDLAGQDPLNAWWPAGWPRLRTAALGLVVGPVKAGVKVSARIDTQGPAMTRSEPPVHLLRTLPSTAVAAWTQSLDFISEYRRIRSRLSEDAEGFHLDSLEAGLEPGVIEQNLLSHLVGDSVLLIDQVTVHPVDARDEETLILPAMALMVETDHPDAVLGTIVPVASNLVKLLNLQTPSDQPIALQQESVVAGGPAIYTVEIGKVLRNRTRCDLLNGLELSMAVLDRWLIIATHSESVRRIIAARRVGGSTLDLRALETVVQQVVSRGARPSRLMVACPRAAAAMIDSWIEHIRGHHPSLLEAGWWDRVLRRQRAMGKQIGILGRASSGTVEVVDVLPDGPAKDQLQPGDRILAVDDIKVDPSAPVKSFREYVAQRIAANQFKLLISRGDRQQEVVIHLPAEPNAGSLKSPMDLLIHLARVSRLFDVADYVLWQPRPDVVEVSIDLHYGPPASQAAESR